MANTKLWQPEMAEYAPVEDVKILELIRLVLARLPEVDLGIGRKVTARILTEAFEIAMPDNVWQVGGINPNGLEHYWLVTPNGNMIDVDPIGILGGPLLIDCIHTCVCPGRSYSKKELDDLPSYRLTEESGDERSHEKCVQKVAREIKRILAGIS